MASKLQQAAKTPKALMQAAASPKNPETRRPTLDVNALVEQGVFNSAEPAPEQERPNLLRIFSQAQDDAMTLGLTKPGGPLDKILAPLFGKEPIQPYQPQTTAEEVAQTAGDIVGSMAPISGLYSTLGRAAAGLIPKAATGIAAKVGRAALPGAVSGGVYEGTKAAVEGKDVGEVAKEAGIGAAMFGGGDVALRAAGKGLKKLYEMARKPKVEVGAPTPEVPPVQAGEQRTARSGAVNMTPETPLPEGISPASLKLPDTKGTITSKSEPESWIAKFAPERVKQAVKTAYYKTIDGYNRINDIDKLMERTTGRKLNFAEKAYILAHNASDSEAVAHKILNEFMVDSKGNISGAPLKTIVQQVPKGAWREFEDYLKLNHFKAWEREGLEVYDKSLNMNEILADRKIADYNVKHPWMQQAAQDYTNWIKDFGEKWLVDTGLISPQGWQAMRQKYQDYIPLQRLLDEVEEGGGAGVRRGFANQPSQVKTAEGSGRKTIESLETLIERIPRTIKAAKRNEVMQRLIKNMQQNPDEMSAFGEIVTPETTNINFPNVVTGRVNGDRVYVRVTDKALLDALTNLNPLAQNLVVEGVRAITSRMKLLTTGINPVFSLGRNIFRDLPMSFIASKSTNNPAVWAYDMVGSLVDILGNREAYKSFKAMGGGYASPLSADMNLLANSKAKIMPGYFDLSNIKNPVEYAKRLLNVPFSTLEKIADVTETLPRLGEYRRIVRQEGDTYATRQKALYEAKDITVNFRKKNTAEITNFLDAFVPYIGAALNGMDKLARVYKDRPVAALTKSFMAITVPTVLLYSINSKNPLYKNESQFIKDNNFLIPLPDGTFFKIPKPREGGVVFGALVERALRQFQDHDPAAWDRLADTLLTNFAPPNPLTSNIASPVVTNLPSNKDFAGRPIVPGYMQGMSPGQQYDEKTSSIAKGLGQAFPEKISPKQVDYLIRSYLGVIAQVGLPALSERSTKDALKSMFVTDPAYSQDTVSKFYEAKSRFDTMKADTRQTGGLLETQDEKLRKLYGKVGDLIGENRKLAREIEKKTLDPEEKKRQLRNLQLKTVALADIVSKPMEAQMGIYNEMKRKGMIVEEKKKTPAAIQRQEASQRKRQEKTAGVILGR